jgi:hypothetical protein
VAWLCCLDFPNTLPNTPDIAAAPQGSYQITATPDRNESAKTQTQWVRARRPAKETAIGLDIYRAIEQADTCSGIEEPPLPLLPRRNSRSLLRRPVGIVVSAVRCGGKDSGTRSSCLPAGEGRWSQAVRDSGRCVRVAQWRVARGGGPSGLVAIEGPGRLG